MLDTARPPVFRFTSLPPLTLYIHLPWCARKCPYCDFNSHAVRDAIPEGAYIDALVADLEQERLQAQGRQIQAVFIGGGTPSLFSGEAIARLLSEIRARLFLRRDIEITLEANPGAIEQRKLAEFRAAGVNRLSIGAQSFNDACLGSLGRIHDGREAIEAVEAAHAAGFRNINIDTMFGLPGQEIQACLEDLRTAVGLAPTHISFYQLTLEPNTVFYKCPPALPHEDAVWEMQTQGRRFLADWGYRRYEVSAYARTDKRCEHNMNYWRFGDYLGIGAGAHGKLSCAATQSISRRWKHRQPREYIQRAIGGDPVAGERVLSADDAVFEFMLNALRLTSGFELRLFAERTGLPAHMLASRMTKLVGRGLLWRRGRRVGPTSLGTRFLDDVVSEFLTCDERPN